MHRKDYMKKGFSIGQVIGFSWETFKKNASLFITLAAVSFLVSLIPSFFEEKDLANDFFLLLFVIAEILSAVLGIIISIGIVKIILNIFDKKEVFVGDVLKYSRYGWRYFFAQLLYALIVILGIITPFISGIVWGIKNGGKEIRENGWYFASLLFVPWLVWAIQYQMVPYLIIDKNIRIIEAFVKSTEVTKKVKLDLFAFGFMTFIVMLIGFLILFVGVFAAVPVIWIAQTYVYRTLLNERKEEATSIKLA